METGRFLIFCTYSPHQRNVFLANLQTSEADPTSVAFPIFQGRTCLPTSNQNLTYTLGGYPAYAVNISNFAQIQLAVNFARNANIRLVIKNTGHCYLGKSGGAGAMSVGTHTLKNIEFIEDYKIEGYAGRALKLGAGIRIREVHFLACTEWVLIT